MSGTEAVQADLRRRRLEPVEQDVLLKPFLRARELEDISLYWAPVEAFPMNFRVRTWWISFLTRFKELLAKQELRQENFLQFKAVTKEQSEQFVATAMDFVPLPGISLRPGSALPPLPDLEETKKEAMHPDFDVEKYVADYTYWFMNKQDEEQRQCFLGMGGMIFLWLKEDPKARPPALKLPASARRWMEASGTDLDGLLNRTYAIQESFLAASKKVFGQTIKDEPVFKGLPFVLPLLSSEHFFRAGAEKREEWFQVFDGYLIESKDDKGVLLALKTPNFDAQLAGLLEGMRAEGMEYPL